MVERRIAVVVEDLGDNMIPYDAWRTVPLKPANEAEIRRATWEVYQRLPFFASKLFLQPIPGRPDEYRVRFQDAIGWHRKPQMSLTMTRAQFDAYLTKHVGLGQREPTESTNESAASWVDQTGPIRVEPHGLARRYAPFPLRTGSLHGQVGWRLTCTYPGS